MVVSFWGQQYADDAHMWGRIMNDVSTYQDEDGNSDVCGSINLSPASEEYEELVAERVEKLRAANPDMDETAIPVDLVTCSGSGLDPISLRRLPNIRWLELQKGK